MALTLSAVFAGQDRPVLEMARAAAASGDFAAADTLYRDALKERPDSAPVWNALGVNLNRQNRFSEAADAFRAAQRLAPAEKGIQLNIGIALFRAGRYADAAKEFEAIHDDRARQLLALSYTGAARYLDAVALLETLTPSSTDPALHVALATCYAALGRNAEADQAVARMLRSVHDSAPLHLALAQAYEKQDNTDRAVAEYERAASMDAALTGAHLQAGRLLWKQGKYAEAEPELLAELQVDPASADTRYYLGTLYAFSDRPGQAREQLERFLRARPNDRNGLFELGKVQLKQHDFDSAIASLEKATALNPEDGGWVFILAQAYRAAGREAEARRTAERAKTISQQQLHQQ